MDKIKKSIGIWIRVSTHMQVQGDSPEVHEQRARMYAMSKDWNIKEVYRLEAVSGKSVMEHPEAKRMLKDIKEGRITGLIFSKLARLARNTKELLEFSEMFRSFNADLISLHESIDTSSPAGRFFYTLISAMAEWEREEIADRVRASVPIRAKMGKPLGGQAPYGYKWVDKKLVLDEQEAPIRKLMFELFYKHKVIKKVCHLLNEKGFRTRKGVKFSDTSVHRLLSDPIAKGLRRVNYTRSLGEGKAWEIKPKEEWVFQKAPIIVSEELWESCSHILNQMSLKNKRKRRTSVYLFSSVLKCTCGGHMYMRTRSPRYVCRDCKNKIEPDIVEEIFHDELKNFLFSDKEIQKHLDSGSEKIDGLDKQLSIHNTKIEELNNKVKKLLETFYAGHMPNSAFEKYHEPLYQELQQRNADVLEITSTIDILKNQTLSNDQVLQDARTLHSQWESFSKEDKKLIIETITDKIIVGNDTIEIFLNYIPTFYNEIESNPIQNANPSPNNNIFLPILLVKLSNATTRIHTCYHHKTRRKTYRKF